MSVLNRIAKRISGSVPEVESGQPACSSLCGREFRRAQNDYHRAGPDSVLVAPRRPGVQAVLLSLHSADLLRRCWKFDTLEGHARRIGRELGLDDSTAQGVLQDLIELAGTGLMWTRDEVVPVSRAETTRSVEIDALGMITGGSERLACALGGLASYVEACRVAGRAPRFVLFDDSLDEATSMNYRDALRRLAGRHRVPALFCGPEEKRRFAQRLVERGLDADLVDFALLGLECCQRKAGANRNAFLLESAGACAMCVDDDTRCRLARVPAARDGLALSSRPEPVEHWFFEHREDALAEPTPVDPLALNERVLGKSLADCVRQSGPDDGLWLDDASDGLLRILSEGGGRVVATSMGVMGDSGMRTTRYRLFARGADRESLVGGGDGRAYGRLAFSREVRRSALRPTISESGFFMSTAMTVDLRQPLPPFFPVLRNQDGIFGATLRKWCPEGAVAHLPWMVAHEPPETRSSSRDEDLAAATGFNTDSILLHCLRSFQCPLGSGFVEERGKLLGRYLKWLGSLRRTDFEELVVSGLREMIARDIEYLEQSLQMFGKEPEAWACDVQEYLDVLSKTASSPDLAVPRDLLEGREPREALALAQDLLMRFGDLFLAWPDMLKVAEQLRGEGLGLVRELSQDG